MLLIITLNLWLLFPLIILILLNLRIKSKLLIYCFFTTITIITLPLHNGLENNEYFHSGEIYDVTSDGIWVEIDNKNYFIIESASDNKYEKNDSIIFECYFEQAEDDFLYYLRSYNSSYFCYAEKISITKEGDKLNNKMSDWIEESDSVSALFFDFLYFGNISEDSEQIINKLGIYHIFVISGFHISLFINSTNLFWKKAIKKDNTITQVLSLLLVLSFVILVYPSIPAIRAYTFHWMLFLNRNFFGSIYSNIDLIIFQGFVFLTINPYLLFNASFVLSFFITLFISRAPKKNAINIALIAFFVSIPILSTFIQEVNLLSPILITLITPLIAPFLVISGFLSFLPWGWFILDWYLILLWEILNVLSLFYIPIPISWIPNYFFMFFILFLEIIIIIYRKFKNDLFSKWKESRYSNKVN